MKTTGSRLTFNVAKEFTDAPGGAYRKDGDKSGEELREDYLVPLLEAHPNETLIIEFDGIIGMGHATVREAFGGLVRRFGKSVIDRIEFAPTKHGHIVELAREYMEEAREALEKGTDMKKNIKWICAIAIALALLLCTGFVRHMPSTGDDAVSIEVVTAGDGHEYVVASVDNRSLINQSGGCGVSITHAVGCKACKNKREQK
jgi:hypothetical protein